MKKAIKLYALPINLAKPAQRALENAGIKMLNDFAKFTEGQISALHGIGPNAIKEIKQALTENILSFKSD